MLAKIKTFAATNRVALIEKGSLALGAIIGLVVVALVTKLNTSDEIVDVVENMDEPNPGEGDPFVE